MKTPQQLHIPVLLDSVGRYLAPRAGEKYLDLTAGYGGHASEILKITQNPEQAVLVDRDKNAIRELKNQCGLANAEFLHSDFLAAAKKLQDSGRKFNLILMDLGVSSAQLNLPERGFSFQLDGPLDMRMDERQSRTAAEVVNRSSEKALCEMIVKYGQEPVKVANRIAHAIRLNRPFSTTKQLADTVAKVHHGRGKIHPATRTFQAIRIVVNDELRQLAEVLPIVVELLESGGRIGVISFHSLEDVIVKNYFNEHSRSGFEATLSLITKKPVTASPSEIVYNPRSRSAKLRVAVKK
ncbi:MAG: 16S rRNA (cytosine(1402)-N(4))-methyltransferase RsmH [Candidatus Nomurabacteria bacterium]|jgi:16S rRNA (cytosine1402-N4)-methyltransferase|nr:16S rRNA (cytosine(1402)-N(4))-methyltransferase RsmH [Candidatus Nomurabacteria bacterium]